MVEALNAAKLDYATFGNHEFELPARYARGAHRGVELQVDLDQLHPGGRHALSQGPALGHRPGARATRSASSASPCRATTAATSAAPTPTARRTCVIETLGELRAPT